MSYLLSLLYKAVLVRPSSRAALLILPWCFSITLKIVLLIVGILLVIYGLYTLFTPEVSMQAGPLKIEAQGDNTQAYAMIGLGILALIGGAAFGKR